MTQDTIDKLIDYIDQAILKHSVSNRHVAAVLAWLNEELKKKSNIEELRNYFISKDRADQTDHLLKMLAGAEFGEFINDFNFGKGAGIDANGNAMLQSLKVRGSATFFDLVFNRLSAVEGDQVYSENGKIIAVEDLGNKTYRLTMEKRWDNDFTAFEEDMILRGVVNNILSSGSVYTSWLRVLARNINNNTITAVMYSDDQVPDGINYPPCEIMKLHRWGGVNDDKPWQQRTWYLSSPEGRQVFLSHVNKPILEPYMYSSFHGLPVNLPSFKKLPLDYEEPYFYAQGAIIQDLWRVDREGKPICEIVDRGQWSETDAVSEPYLFEQRNEKTGLFETHDAWRGGVRYRCLNSGTTNEPRSFSSDWREISGTGEYKITFVSSTGSFSFLRGRVEADFSAYISHSGRDITELLLSIPGVEVEWLRDSGNVPSDNSWRPTYVDNQLNVIHITTNDCGHEWMIKRMVRFIFRIYVPLGDVHIPYENSLNIHL